MMSMEHRVWTGTAWIESALSTHTYKQSISLLNMLPLHLNPAIPQGEQCDFAFVGICVCLLGGLATDPQKVCLSIKLLNPTHPQTY